MNQTVYSCIYVFNKRYAMSMNHDINVMQLSREREEHSSVFVLLGAVDGF